MNAPDVTSPTIPSQRQVIPLSSTGDAQKFCSFQMVNQNLILNLNEPIGERQAFPLLK